MNKYIIDINPLRAEVDRFLFNYAEDINVGDDHHPIALIDAARRARGYRTQRESMVREMKDMVNQLTTYLIQYAMQMKFKSIPKRHRMAYDEYVQSLLMPGPQLPKNATELEKMIFVKDYESKADRAYMLFEPLRQAANEMLEDIPDNLTWHMVDYTPRGRTLIVRVGRDLRIELFERLHGNEQWSGPMFDAEGKMDDEDISNIRLIID